MKQFATLYLLLCTTIANAHTGQDFHRYLWANYQQFDQQFTQAQHYYNPLLQSNPSPYAYKGYLNLLQETGQWAKIIGLLGTIDTTFAQDVEIQMIAAQALERTGNQNACDERIIKLNDQCKTNQELAFGAAQIYQRRKEPENALKVIERYLNATGDKANNFIFHFMKSQIYVQMEKKPQALASVKKSLELYPKFDKSWLLMAILEEQAGRIEQAVSGYTHFLQETQDSKTVVQEHLAALMMQHKISAAPQANTQQNCFAQAQGLKNQGQFDRALAAIDSCLQKEPNNTEYRLFKIDTLASMKQFGKAADQLKDWIIQDPHQEMWYQTLHLLSNHGLPLQDLINVFGHIEKKYKDHALPLLYLADLHIRAQSPHALSYLKKAAAASTDKRVKVRILYQVALLQYDKRAFKDAKKTLLQIYELNKDFLPALNLLAYYYASKEKNLVHAYHLIEQVVMKAPSNPHYLDTKAFILYKQGNYAPARSLLQQCLKMAPQDATIKRHLAKTLYKMGETATAKTLLDQAVAQASASGHEKKKLVTLAQRWNNERKK